MIKYVHIFSIVLTFMGLGFSTADAQNNIAQQAMMCKQLINRLMDVSEGKHAFVKCLVTIFVIVLLFAPIVEIVAETQAITDATGDAKNYNATSWAIGGILATPTSLGVSLGVCLLAPDFFLSVTSNDAGWALCVGAIPAVVIMAARTSRVTPPTERLMGKSPEYVSVYVKTYTKLVKRKRQQYAIMGCAAGSLVTGVLAGCTIGVAGAVVGDADGLADEVTEGCCLGGSAIFDF